MGVAGWPGATAYANRARRWKRAIESAHAPRELPGLNPGAAPSGEAALRAIGWPPAGAPLPPGWAELMAAHPRARPARVVGQHRSGYLAADGTGPGASVESLPDWQRPRFPPERQIGRASCRELVKNLGRGAPI